MSGAGPPGWEEAVRAAAVFALDPAGIGGVALRAPAGVARDRWLGTLRGMIEGPVRKLPASIAEDRLLGGLDLAATLAAGTPRRLRGALCEADGGVVLLAMAERLPAGTAARIALAQDAGTVEGEAARFGFVLLDEGIGEERPAAALLERAGVHLDLAGLLPDGAETPDLRAARALLPAVAVDDSGLEALCEAAAGLGVGSGRGRVRVLARDDGSIDGTVRLLEGFAARWPERFRVLPAGRPTGSAKGNFLELMRAATAEYVGFADQDDVWLPGKVRLSMDAMRRMEERHGRGAPLLVFTDVRVVDEGLRTVAESMWARSGVEAANVHRMERLLGQNVVTGCSMVVNRTMLELARRMPEAATMHDRWIGLLAASMGAAEALPERTVLYRQHGANVIGAPAEDRTMGGRAARARSGGGDRRRERWLSEAQAEALLAVHGAEMSERRRRVLRAYLRSGRSGSAAVRLGTTVRYGFWRAGVLRNLATTFDLLRGRSRPD